MGKKQVVGDPNDPSTWKAEGPTEEKEFGGPIGCFALFLFSHFIVYYLWACLVLNGGGLVLPQSDWSGGPVAGVVGLDWAGWGRQLWTLISTTAAPSWTAVQIYWGFLIVQALLSMLLPGIHIKGLPVPSEGGRRLDYNCNGISAWYVSLAAALAANYYGVFRLSSVIDNLGSLITVAMISSDLLAVAAYAMSYVQRRANRASGNVFYDFFMGTYLNPRLFNLDLKMWGEIRVAWIMLFFLTLSAACKQYELYGALSTPMIFMLCAHGLYTNACMKGEECIPTTWDVFYEQWGWMLIYWNFCGVPFVYCFQSMYIAAREPFDHAPLYNAVLFVALFTAYYIWDTAQSQRNRFRMKENGSFVKRWAFPQLPWGTLDNPSYLTTDAGSKLLLGGWWKYARKIHYTCDIVMALCWGLCCGFNHFLPYFYFVFFFGMIMHRAARDEHKCALKYRHDWDLYKKEVPYLYIPGIY